MAASGLKKASTVKKASSTSSAASSKTPAATSAPVSNDMIASRVHSAQVIKAFKALQAHRKKHKAAQAEESKDTGKSQLPLSGDDSDAEGSSSRTDDTVYVNVNIKRLDNNKKAKPVMIPLPHSLYDPSNTAVCLFVKDPQRHYKDLLPTLGVKCVHRIVGVSKLKGKFAPFEARRQLLEDYDIFLCDERIGPLMPKLLGSKWMSKKKMPLSVNLVRTKHIKAELEKAVSATRFTANRGTNISVAVGSISRHSSEALVENLTATLNQVVRRIPFEGWNNVQSIEVKTGKSASLPIWNANLSQRWEGIPEEEEEESDFAVEAQEEVVQKRASAKKSTASAPQTSSKAAATKDNGAAPAEARPTRKVKSSSQVNAGARAAASPKSTPAAKVAKSRKSSKV